MNIKLLKKISRRLRKRKPPNVPGFGPVGFNMYDWKTPTRGLVQDRVDSCGTVACIAGWAVAIADPTCFRDGTNSEIVARAEQLLDLRSQSQKLFMGYGSLTPRQNITADEAADTIDRLIVTGKVQWYSE